MKRNKCRASATESKCEWLSYSLSIFVLFCLFFLDKVYSFFW